MRHEQAPQLRVNTKVNVNEARKTAREGRDGRDQEGDEDGEQFDGEDLWIKDALMGSGWHGSLDDIEQMMTGQRDWPQGTKDFLASKHGLDAGGVANMLKDQAASVQQLTKLRESKERARKAKEKSDAIPDTVSTSLIKYCTACGRPDCDFAPITIKVPNKGGKKK